MRTRSLGRTGDFLGDFAPALVIAPVRVNLANACQHQISPELAELVEQGDAAGTGNTSENRGLIIPDDFDLADAFRACIVGAGRWS